MAEPYEQPIMYGLDSRHIQEICRSVTDDANFTMLEWPSRMFVHSRDHASEVLSVLGKVGYDADTSPTDPSTTVVHGWSKERLDARIIGLRSTVERLEDALPDTPTRAVDAYVARFAEPEINAAGYQASRMIQELLRQDVLAITGPHAPHDPQVVPTDRQTEDRVKELRRLELRVDDLIHQHWMAAADAIDIYNEARDHSDGHEQAREIAISDARRHIEFSRPLSAPASDDHHPAALAAVDQPAARTETAPVTHPSRRPSPPASPVPRIGRAFH